MTWGIEKNVIERFEAAGVPRDRISFARDTYSFNFPGAPREFVDIFMRYWPDDECVRGSREEWPGRRPAKGAGDLVRKSKPESE